MYQEGDKSPLSPVIELQRRDPAQIFRDRHGNPRLSRSAVIDMIPYRQVGIENPPADWPPVGTKIEAVAAALTEHNHQIKLRVGSPPRR